MKIATKHATILANVSNIMVVLFLLIMIPSTIVGIYSLVVERENIKENTKFRIEARQTIDSLQSQLRVEKFINEVHRDVISETLETTDP